MNKITQEIIAIEEIRRRAKDNKAKNAEAFSFQSEMYLDKTRNVLFIFGFSSLAYLGTIQKSLSSCEVIMLLISNMFGVISYFYSYKYSISLSQYYSDLERNLSTSFPNQDEYSKMLDNEAMIDKKHSKRYLPQLVSILSMSLQALVLFASLLSALI